MEIFILNSRFEGVNVLDSYESLLWVDRYWSWGEFEVVTPMKPDLVDTIKLDNYAQIAESDRTMIIEKIQVVTDVVEGSKMKISGRSIESILDRRIIWGLLYLNDLSLQNGVKRILDKCIIDPTNPIRQIQNFVFKYSTDPLVNSFHVNTQYTGNYVYEVIK